MIHTVAQVLNNKIAILIYIEIGLSYESFYRIFMSRPVTYSLRNVPYLQPCAGIVAMKKKGGNYLTSNVLNNCPDILKITGKKFKLV